MRKITGYLATLFAKQSHKKRSLHSQSVGGEARFNKNFSAVLIPKDGKREAIRENTPRAKSAIDVDLEGKIKQTVSGQSYQNEDNTLAACVNLISYLNENSESWQQPILQGPPRPDCFVQGLQDSSKKMQIQVTRLAHKRYELSKDHFTSSEETAEGFALEVITTIERKAQGFDNSGHSLLIDAGDTPFALTKTVLNAVRTKYADRLSASGFDRIWIVGNTSNLVFEII